MKGVIRLDTAGAENYKARGSCSVDQSLDGGAGAKDASDARPALDTTADGLTSLSCSELLTAYSTSSDGSTTGACVGTGGTVLTP